MIQNDINTDNIKSQMRKGILEYGILSILDKQDAYAPSMMKILKDAQMMVVEGTLYPLLTRLKNQGMLSYRWEESQQGPPRKYYSITASGVRQLEAEKKQWAEFSASVNQVLGGGAYGIAFS